MIEGMSDRALSLLRTGLGFRASGMYEAGVSLVVSRYVSSLRLHSLFMNRERKNCPLKGIFLNCGRPAPITFFTHCVWFFQSSLQACILMRSRVFKSALLKKHIYKNESLLCVITHFCLIIGLRSLTIYETMHLMEIKIYDIPHVTFNTARLLHPGLTL